MINPNLGIPLESGSQKYPAIQATCYKPNMGDQVSLCLSESSVGILAPQWKDWFAQFQKEVYYGVDRETVYGIPADAQFVFLGIPKTFAQDKSDKTIHPLKKGVKLAQMGEKGSVTATRCLLLMQVGGEFVMTADGEYQMFTLKLTSTKTKLLAAPKEPEYRSIAKLNSILIEHYKLKPGQSWTHLVSLGLKAVPTVFSQRNGNDSSIGVMFEVEGKPTPLADDKQQAINFLALSDEVRNFLKDPFNLSEKKNDDGDVDYGGNSDFVDDDDGTVPF